MFTIYADDICIYDDTKSSDLELQLVSPKLVLADNSAGTFTATIPTTNIGYTIIERLRTTITILRDGEWLWTGRVLSEDQDFWNNRKVTCEGVLAYLNDTNQEPAKYEHVTIESFLTSLLNRHNQHMPMNRRIFIGDVTVVDTEDPLTTYETTYDDTTISCVNNKLLNVFGGHMVIRKGVNDGLFYLDYLSLDEENPGHTNSQQIDFGKNLLDFTRKFEADNFATVLLPLGAQADDGQYVTVKKVNDDSEYVESEAVDTYGWITKVVHFDNVAMPWRLMQKAEEYLSKLQFDSVVIELKAIDLSVLNPNIESFNLLDTVNVVSHPHGMDREFPITKIDMPLDSPENVVYTLGGTIQESLTTIEKNSSNKIESKIEGLPETITEKVIKNNICEEQVNQFPINLGNGTSQVIAAFNISPTENTSIIFHAEVSHHVDTIESTTTVDNMPIYTEHDCEIFATYRINGAVQNYHPVFTEYDGDQTLHLLYHFTILAGADVQFACALTVNDADVTIDAGCVRSYILGDAQIEDGEWGSEMTVSATDTVNGISLLGMLAGGSLTDSVTTEV